MIDDLQRMLDEIRRARPRPKPVYIDKESMDFVKRKLSDDGAAYVPKNIEGCSLFGLPVFKWGEGYVMGHAGEIFECLNDPATRNELLSKLV